MYIYEFHCVINVQGILPMYIFNLFIIHYFQIVISSQQQQQILYWECDHYLAQSDNNV